MTFSPAASSPAPDLPSTPVGGGGGGGGDDEELYFDEHAADQRARVGGAARRNSTDSGEGGSEYLPSEAADSEESDEELISDLSYRSAGVGASSQVHPVDADNAALEELLDDFSTGLYTVFRTWRLPMRQLLLPIMQRINALTLSPAHSRPGPARREEHVLAVAAMEFQGWSTRLGGCASRCRHCWSA